MGRGLTRSEKIIFLIDFRPTLPSRM